MKGVELPISTIIVIVLVLIVLVAIIAMFYGIWPKGAEAATLESVKNNACQILLTTGGCDSISTATKTVYISNFDANKNGVNSVGSGIDLGATACTKNDAGNDNLFMLCKCWYNMGGNEAEIDKACRTQVCHCPTD